MFRHHVGWQTKVTEVKRIPLLSSLVFAVKCYRSVESMGQAGPSCIWAHVIF